MTPSQSFRPTNCKITSTNPFQNYQLWTEQNTIINPTDLLVQSHEFSTLVIFQSLNNQGGRYKKNLAFYWTCPLITIREGVTKNLALQRTCPLISNPLPPLLPPRKELFSSSKNPFVELSTFDSGLIIRGFLNHSVNNITFM